MRAWPGLFMTAAAAAGVVLSACAPALPPAASPPRPANSATPPAALTMTLTPAPSATAVAEATAVATATLTATPTASPTATPTSPPPAQLCSPLEGITLAEIGQPDVLKNPFDAPRPGMDDGHYGADFAYWSRGERTTMLGLPVYAALPGIVAGRINDRQPYGNAVIIETPLEWIPAAWLAAMQVPTPAPTVPPSPSLSCPPPLAEADTTGAGRSLYLLYAHLDQPSPALIGQPVACGQLLGGVGTTGRSVNYHLHLETRAGPAGAVFYELAHYDNTATENERRNYCTWRVSGRFQAFDPMLLLSLQP